MVPDFSKYFDDGARWGVGVSGGGDSVGLLVMLLAAGFGAQVRVLHFNHKWGAFGDKAETFVKELAKAKKVEASFGKGRGRAAANAEAKARAARLAFFAAECKAHGLAGVMVAHTRDDDVEGFFIRLARGSGLKGLAGMAEDAEVAGVRVVRPLLGASRKEVRDFAKKAKVAWVEDPANADDAYLRVRVRKVLPALEKAGVEVEHVAASVAALRRADAALEAVVAAWWASHAVVVKGEVRLDAAALRAQPEDVAQRLLAKVQDTLRPGQMPVRMGKRLALLEKIRQNASGKATLGAVLWLWNGQRVAARPERATMRA